MATKTPKALDVQKKMNNLLARSHKPPAIIREAHRLFNKMNKLRRKEGLSHLTMPNLEKAYKALK